MKHMRYIKIIGIISALLFLVSCGGGGGGGAASVGFSTIKITIGGVGPTAKIEIKEDTLFSNIMDLITPAEAIAQTCYFPQDVKRIFFSIEGNDMTTITGNVTVNNCPIVREFQVPNGSSRVFNAYAYNAADKQAYSGSTPSAVPAVGNLVQIIMKPIVLECDLYVDINNNVGDLSNDCTDPSEPCETITHALDPAQTPLGDETICVFDGIYSPEIPDFSIGEIYPLIVDRNIKLYCVDENLTRNPFRECFLDGQRLVREGVEISAGATISNFTVSGFYAPRSGITVPAGNTGSPTIINNKIVNNEVGVSLQGGNPLVLLNNITNNQVGLFVGEGAPKINYNSIWCNSTRDLANGRFENSGVLNAQSNLWDNWDGQEPWVLLPLVECLPNAGVDTCIYYEGNTVDFTGGGQIDSLCYGDY
jgi:hypothetical protein